MNELKPCPFCGGEAVLEYTSDTEYVYCIKCDATTNIFDRDDEDAPAFEAWNSRTEGKDNE